jgi:hypothetical protein
VPRAVVIMRVYDRLTSILLKNPLLWLGLSNHSAEVVRDSNLAAVGAADELKVQGVELGHCRGLRGRFPPASTLFCYPVNPSYPLNISGLRLLSIC